MTVPKFTLYTNKYCPYVARAAIALAETHHEHDKVEIDLTVPRPDWYLKDINPYGQVPALKVNDDNIILESLIVAEYIAEIHPESELLSNDALQRAQSRYLIQHWGSRTHPAIHKAIVSLDPVESAKLRQDVIVELEKVDVLLRKASGRDESSGPFFLGDKFTYADLALAPFLARLFLISAYQEKGTHEAFEASLRENPKVQRFLTWRDALLKRPSLQNATAPQEELVQAYRKYLPKAN
ncbi:thioredoxin-like protein [Mortierella sp. GBAus27b]|nr:hypothetical protein BGX31_005615 [Mortierella sp. GBA43]KAI8361640.1 thioredoxin-like protein [Mortierella sp. GBAus27b]